MDKIDDILSYDPLYETEKMVGKNHYSEFDEFENGLAMLNFFNHNQRKEELLKSCEDTYFNMSWNYFINLIKQHGFIEGLTYNFKHCRDKDREEQAILYYHPKKGLVIWATSYDNKTSVSGGNLYGEIKANSIEECNTVRNYMSTGGCIDIDNMVYETQQDIREGLIRKIERLESAGTFLSKWTSKDRFLWFLDYTEENTPGYDYKAITTEKIEKCPREVQEIIGR